MRFQNLKLILCFKHQYRYLHISRFKPKNSFFSVTHYSKSNDEDSNLLLRYLTNRKLREARDVLEKMPQREKYSSNIVRWTSILSNFGKSGFVDEARCLFDLMPERNLVTYNAMLSAYVQSGRHDDACRFFKEMPEKNVVSWTSMLCGLTHVGRISDAKVLFDNMPDKNVVSWNSMIVGLIRNGELLEAREVFDKMPERNQVSWNVMIAGYAENCMMEEARVLFDLMLDPNVVTWTSLIAGYCRAGDVEEGYQIFRRMQDRNIVSWTAMIGGFTWNGFFKDALLLYLEMRGINDLKPNGETFISLVYACSGLGFSQIGRQLHAHMILNGWDHDDYDGRLSKSLIHMYSEFGIMDFAHYIFSKKTNPCALQSCNTMINGYIRIGLLEKARYLFDSIPIRDGISWTSMISGYFHTGDVKEAYYLFDWMPGRDAVAWTVVISGHVQNELFTEAIYFFSKMRFDGIKPLASTYSTLLGASGAIANLDQGKQFHCLLMKTQSKHDIILCNSLISMYAKCGQIENAKGIFSNMISRDVVSWNSMILGLSHHGFADEALKLYDAMQDSGTNPNSITFLAVISACSHAGLVKRGWELFNSMSQDHGIQPGMEHYVNIVDLLGRAGRVEEAEDFVLSLPFKPGLVIWGALLGVCGLGEKNAVVARRTALRVLELDPSNAPAHVLLCNLYAEIGRHGEEEILRKEMGLKGVRKVPGCSWIVLKGSVHIFSSGSRSHPQSDMLLSLLNRGLGF